MVSASKLTPAFTLRALNFPRGLLILPFTPFLVVFTQIINGPERADFELLSHFLESLQAAKAVSPGAARLLEMCDKFYRVAEAYCEERVQRETPVPVETIQSFLGFDHLPISHDVGMSDDEPETLPLSNWFAGQYMMGALI
jgi:hypothetical protein